MLCEDITSAECARKGYSCYCNSCQYHRTKGCSITRENTCPLFGCPEHKAETPVEIQHKVLQDNVPVVFLAYNLDAGARPDEAYLVYGLDDPVHLENLIEEYNTDTCDECEGRECNTCTKKDTSSHISHLKSKGHLVTKLLGIIVSECGDTSTAQMCDAEEE